MRTFKVLKSNPNKKGEFVTKLQAETKVDAGVFGEKIKKETYYISAEKQLEVGLAIPEKDIFPMFRVEEHPMTNPETQEEFLAKWLHLA